MKRLRSEQMLLVGVGLCGLYLVLRWYLSLPSGPDMTLTVPEDRVPLGVDVTLPDLHGNILRLADLRGQVVLLNFWATWCHPCRVEMPSMQALYEAYRTKGFTIIAVASDTQGARVVAPFTQRHGLTFPILLDAENVVGTQLQLQGIPTTFLLDKRGRIAGIEIGARDWQSSRFRRAFDTLLAEKPLPHDAKYMSRYLIVQTAFSYEPPLSTYGVSQHIRLDGICPLLSTANHSLGNHAPAVACLLLDRDIQRGDTRSIGLGTAKSLRVQNIHTETAQFGCTWPHTDPHSTKEKCNRLSGPHATHLKTPCLPIRQGLLRQYGGSYRRGRSSNTGLRREGTLVAGDVIGGHDKAVPTACR